MTTTNAVSATNSGASTPTGVSLRLSAAKLELRSALSSLERVTSHDYTPAQAALIQGAKFQIERAARIVGQIYLAPPEQFDVITPPFSEVKLLPLAPKLPVEDVIHEDNK